MKLIIRHHGRIREGKLIWDIPKLYNQNILELEGQDITMEIKKRHRKATHSQYGYYRGAILGSCYQSEMFVTLSNKDEIHDLYFAPKFLSFVTLTNIGGIKKEVTRVRSLADLADDEMGMFIEKVLEECKELNIIIPPPENFYAKYYEK